VKTAAVADAVQRVKHCVSEIPGSCKSFSTSSSVFEALNEFLFAGIRRLQEALVQPQKFGDRRVSRRELRILHQALKALRWSKPYHVECVARMNRAILPVNGEEMQQR
jgi:hypothetical protein